jgi:hypothetical protein
MRPIRLLRVFLLAGMLAIASLGVAATSVAAYGHADQPLAQIEFSANCNNPDFGLCQQVGLGGVWFWIEIDANASGDIAGAGCGHVQGGPRGGAGSIRGDITWWAFHGSPDDLMADGIFSFAVDPGGDYYVVPLGPGETFAFPMTVGHYSYRPVAGVTAQTQIAP